MSPDAKKLVLEHSNQLQECRLERVKVTLSVAASWLNKVGTYLKTFLQINLSLPYPHFFFQEYLQNA